MTAPLILTGQLLGVAFACGLNLYLTVVVLGLSARFDLLTGLPPAMRGIENGVIIGLAGMLYLVGLIVDRVPALDHIWEAAHTIIRPAAAGLLIGLTLMGAPLHLQVAGGLAGAIMALAAHGTKAGLRLIMTPSWIDERGHIRPRRSLARTGLPLLEDVAAALIVLTAVLYPEVVGFVVAGSFLLLLVTGPRLWRAAMLGLHAVVARMSGFFGRRGWRSRSDLPRGLRGALPAEPVGRRPARAVRATVRGLPGTGAYRAGWLVFTCDGPRFLYSAGFRARSATIGGVSHVDVRPGVLADTVSVRTTPDATITFFLFKDGPPLHMAATELTSVSS
ncbi:MAG TPA: DUF4126 domain-containing protein [Longimicrobiales bacterium]|nr:DUF4126 domain-containing protein [Longimicrobiales bacterium]